MYRDRSAPGLPHDHVCYDCPLTVIWERWQAHQASGSTAPFEAGYGTNDCFRGNAGIMFRDFMGEGRILDLSGRVSKVGIGRPTNWGFQNNVCSPLADDSIGSHELNYNVTAALRRPAFLSSNNTLVFTAFTELRSEFKVFLRQETGFSVGINRQTPMRRLPFT